MAKTKGLKLNPSSVCVRCEYIALRLDCLTSVESASRNLLHLGIHELNTWLSAIYCEWNEKKRNILP